MAGVKLLDEVIKDIIIISIHLSHLILKIALKFKTSFLIIENFPLFFHIFLILKGNDIIALTVNPNVAHFT